MFTKPSIWAVGLPIETGELFEVMVPKVGVEPTRALSPKVFETFVSLQIGTVEIGTTYGLLSSTKQVSIKNFFPSLLTHCRPP